MSRLTHTNRELRLQFFQTGTARQAAMPLNRGHGDLSLTRRPMVSRSGELEVEDSGLEVSESKFPQPDMYRTPNFPSKRPRKARPSAKGEFQ